MKTKQLFNVVFLVIFALSGLTITSCKKNIGPDNPETPQVLDGKRELVINAKQFNSQSLSDFTIKVSGPENMTVSPSGQSYTLNLTKNGTYTVSISKTGYLGMTKVVQVELPGDVKVTWRHEVDLYLVKKSAPVTINNATGGTITVAPTGLGSNGTNGKPTIVTIPAGALSGAGSTDIAITLIPVDPSSFLAQTITGGTGSVAYYIEPEGLIFNAPVSFEIPFNLPASLATQVPFHFVSKTGDVSVGTMNFSSDQAVVNVSSNGLSATVQVTKSAYWQVVGDYTVTATPAYSEYIEAGSSSFGAALTGVYTATGTYGTMYAALLDIPVHQVSISQPFSYPAVEFFKVMASARHTNVNYTIKITGTNNTIEQFTVPSTPVDFIFSIMAHNQGGS